MCSVQSGILQWGGQCPVRRRGRTLEEERSAPVRLRGRVGKNGVVRDRRVHEDVLAETAGFAAALGFTVRALDFSPITGPQGNVEFLMLLEKGGGAGISDLPAEAARVVRAAQIICTGD